MGRHHFHLLLHAEQRKHKEANLNFHYTHSWFIQPVLPYRWKEEECHDDIPVQWKIQ